MKTSIHRLCRPLALLLPVVGLSSCSLFANGKYASEWEIQSEVPASLNSGQASGPSGLGTNAQPVRSNLSGLATPAMADAGSLDLPVLEGSGIIDIPKPSMVLNNASLEQSPPEMLNIPGASAASDLPYGYAAGGSLTTLLPEPPPVVTEAELAAAPSALPPAVTEETLSAPMDRPLSPLDLSPMSMPLPGSGNSSGGVGVSEKSASNAAVSKPGTPGTRIPLLYGNLDLTPFLPPVEPDLKTAGNEGNP